MKREVSFNSQLCAQCTIKVNNIQETSEMKTAFPKNKLRIASRKFICLEFHYLVNIFMLFIDKMIDTS